MIKERPYSFDALYGLFCDSFYRRYFKEAVFHRCISVQMGASKFWYPTCRRIRFHDSVL